MGMEPVQPRTWKEFFDGHAPHYDQNVFTRNTLVEVQFLWDTMGLEPGMRLLDVGCGTGRHAVELAKRGLEVTGVDVSTGMLEVARAKAAEAGVLVEFIEADATTWRASDLYDAAICLCEGGMGLINHDEDPVAHDLGILRGIGASLNSGAPFVMTAMNGYATIRRATDEFVEQGSFDPGTMVMAYADEWELPEGKVPMLIRERLFIPPELASMLHHAGFAVEHIWGGTAGEWGERPLKLDEIEVMFVAHKR